jgi:hypothetical protein
MAKDSLVAHGRQKLDEARRALHDALDDFSVPVEEVLELRRKVQRALDDQNKLERKSKGLFSFLRF